jgi:predicted Zn-dependent protease
LRKKRFITVFMVLALMIAAYPNKTADATVLGGKWASDFNCYIQTSTYYGYAYNSIDVWNDCLDSIGSNMDISTSTTSYSVYITQTSSSLSDWFGLTDLYPSQSSSIYTAANVTYNHYYLANEGTTLKTAVAIHEMGHVLGLAHTANESNDSIMLTYVEDAIDRGITGPTSYDISDLDSIY